MTRQELFKQLRKNYLLLLGVFYLILRCAGAQLYHVYPIMRRGTDVYSSGSAVFILRQNVDWLLIALTAYCGVCIWVREFSADMQDLHLTAKCGRAGLLRIKFLTAIVYPVLLSVQASCAELGIDMLRFGQTALPLSAIGFDYQDTTRTGFTLHYALLLIPLKALGTASFAALVSAAALCIKRTLPVLLSALALILVPVYLFPSSDLRCRLCLPVALMQGKELLRSSVSFQNDMNETEFLYREITDGELLRCVLVQFAVITICGCLCRRLYLQKPIRLRLVAAVLSAFLLTGCGHTLPDISGAPQFHVCNDCITVYNKSDGTEFSLNPTPLTNYQIAEIYGAYALVTEPLPDAALAFTVSLLHLPDLTKTELLTVGRAANTDGLLGLDDLIDVPPAWIFDFDTYGMSPQMRLDGNILYGKTQNALVSFDLSNGERTEWLPGVPFIAPQMRDGVLYYLDEAWTLCRITKGGDTEALLPDVADYQLCPHSLCYIAQGHIFRMSEGSDTQQLCEDKADHLLYCDDTRAVFLSQDMQTVAVIGDAVLRYDSVFDSADESCLYSAQDAAPVWLP